MDNATFPLPPGQTSCYQGRHPLGDCLAEKAISIIGANLVQAVENPTDLAAREAMALGAMLAGLAFSNVGVALVHALEYPIGGATHCSHGAGNGMLLPYVMRYNLPVRMRELARVARAAGRGYHGSERPAGGRTRDHSGRTIESKDRHSHAIERAGSPPRTDPRVRRKGTRIARIVRVNPRVPTVPEMIELLNAAY